MGVEVGLAAPIVEALGLLAGEESTGRTVAAVGVVAAEMAVVAIEGCWCSIHDMGLARLCSCHIDTRSSLCSHNYP